MEVPTLLKRLDELNEEGRDVQNMIQVTDAHISKMRLETDVMRQVTSLNCFTN